MCNFHWRKIPHAKRLRVYETYRPGQERDKQPSTEYLDAAFAAVHWLHRHEGVERSPRCLACVETV